MTMPKRCSCCNKFQKKEVQLDDRGYCPSCQQLHPINEEDNKMPIDEETVNISVTEETAENEMAIEEKIEKEAEPISEAFDMNVDISKLVERGKKGVTNKQMIPAMKTYIDNNEVEKLRILKAAFPPVFESTIKYIGAARQAKLKEMAI